MDDTAANEVAELKQRLVCRLWKFSSYGTFSCFMRPDGGATGIDDMTCIAEKFRTKSLHASSGLEAASELAEVLHGLGFRARMPAKDAMRLLLQHPRPAAK